MTWFCGKSAWIVPMIFFLLNFVKFCWAPSIFLLPQKKIERTKTVKIDLIVSELEEKNIRFGD